MNRIKTTIGILVLAAAGVAVWLTPKVIAGVIVTVGLIAAVTAWAWRKYGAAPSSRGLVIPLYGGLLALVAVGVGVILYTTGRANYSLCVDRVERSEKAHASSLLLYDTFDAATGTDHYTNDALIPGRPSLRASLAAPLTRGECDKYKP